MLLATDPVVFNLELGTAVTMAGTIASGLTAGAVAAIKIFVSYLERRDKNQQESAEALVDRVEKVADRFEAWDKIYREEQRETVKTMLAIQKESVTATQALTSRIDALDHRQNLGNRKNPTT